MGILRWLESSSERELENASHDLGIRGRCEKEEKREKEREEREGEQREKRRDLTSRIDS